MEYQTKVDETVFVERREACSFSGPSCVVDLDPISERCAEMGHGTGENRAGSEEDGVHVCVCVCVCIGGMVGLCI